MKRRLLTSASTAALLLLVCAPLALADADNDHGEGWFGETNDLAITYAGFIIIAAVPLFVLLASIAYHVTDKRREARVRAEFAREARSQDRGGW